MNENCLEIIGLSYLDIFSNFSVAFENGRFITISGPNNCGKTTLLRIIGNEIKVSNSILVYNKRIEDYKITELSNIINTVIPLEITFTQKTVEDELSYQLPVNLPKESRQKRIKEVAKIFKLTKFLTESVESLNEQSLIRLQLAISILNEPQIILIDDLNPYFEKKELMEIVNELKKLNIEKKVTIIMIVSNLNIALQSDYMYVINESKIVIEGSPISVLEKDNVLNKAGLNLPFMMDLSVKLKDYDLIKKIELDMDGMVDTLWN